MKCMYVCMGEYLAQDFSHVCPSFDLQRVNALELAMLEALKYVIRVRTILYSYMCMYVCMYVCWIDMMYG